MSSPHLTRLREGLDAAPLPAALAAVLVLALIAQLTLPTDVSLPESELAPARVQTPGRIVVPPVPAYPTIAARNPFAPGGGKGAAAEGEITLVGLARSRTSGTAILRGGDGETAVLRPGERFGKWRLIAIGRTGVVLASKEEQRGLRLGQSIAAPTPAETPQDAPSDE